MATWARRQQRQVSVALLHIRSRGRNVVRHAFHEPESESRGREAPHTLLEQRCRQRTPSACFPFWVFVARLTDRPGRAKSLERCLRAPGLNTIGFALVLCYLVSRRQLSGGTMSAVKEHFRIFLHSALGGDDFELCIDVGRRRRLVSWYKGVKWVLSPCRFGSCVGPAHS